MKMIEGFIAAPFSPFDRNGNIKIELISGYAKLLKHNGIRGVFVNGTTGEGYSLTTNERIEIAEFWLDTRTADFKVMIHVGAESLREAEVLAKHSMKNGADAIGIMSPVFFKPALSQLADYCARIASQAEGVPFYYYHIPSMTGNYVSVVSLISALSELIPSFRGIKYTHNDLMEYRLCLHKAAGKLDVFYGRDETLLSGLALGAKAMIGSTYNYAMPVYHKLISAYENGKMDEASQWQLKSMQLVQVLESHGGGTVAGKAIMNIIGYDLGLCRLPNRQVFKEESELIEQKLHDFDLLELLST